MAPKRKQPQIREPTAKERNTIYPPEFRDGQWPVEQLEGKRNKRDGTKYLVRWKDDPVTGQTYPSEWLDEVNIGDELIEEFENRTQRKRRKGARRIILDSQDLATINHTSRNFDTEFQGSLEIAETQESEDSRLTATSSPPKFKSQDGPNVYLPTLPSSFDRDEYPNLEYNSSQQITQNTSGSPILPISSREGDEDSAIDLTLPSDVSRSTTASSPQNFGVLRAGTQGNPELLQNEPNLGSVQVEQSDPVENSHSGTPARGDSPLFCPETTGPAQTSRAGESCLEVSDQDSHTQSPIGFLETTLPQIPPALNNTSTKHHNTRLQAQKTPSVSPSFQTQVALLQHSSEQESIVSSSNIHTNLEASPKSPSGRALRPRKRHSSERPLRSAKRASDLSLPRTPTSRMANRSATPETMSPTRSSRGHGSPASLHDKLRDLRRNTNVQIASNNSPSVKKDDALPSPLSRPPMTISTPFPEATASGSATSIETNLAQVADILPTTELPSTMQQARDPTEMATPIYQSPSTDPSLPATALPVLLETAMNQTVASPPSLPYERPILFPSEYAVALPAEGHMQHRYREWFREKDLKNIGRFLRRSDSVTRQGMPLGDSMRSLIAQLNLAAVHPDFNIDPQKFESLALSSKGPASEAAWADMGSTKFAFLGELLSELARYRPAPSIMIMARSGQTIETLDIYLRGKDIPFRRPIPSAPRQDAPVNVILVPSDDKSCQHKALQTEQRPEMVLDFDGSMTADDPFLRMFDGNNSQMPTMPLVHVIVVNSPEHVDKCLPRSMPPDERMRNLVLISTHLRRALGRLPIGAGLTAEQLHYQMEDLSQTPTRMFSQQTLSAAKMVAACLLSDNFRDNWRLVPLPHLDLHGIENTITLLEASAGPMSNSHSRTGTPTTLKRGRDQTGTPVSSKRMKGTPLQEITHISDSLKDSQSQIDDLSSRLRSERAAHATETSTLHTSLSDTQVRLAAMTDSLSKLQHRYEIQRQSLRALTKEKSTVEANLAASETKRERLVAENSILKDQRTALNNDLNAAREQLKAGDAGPLAGDIEATREKIASLERERDNAIKSAESVKKDFEFTRQQYQTASNAAADHANSITELEAKVARLEKEASDEKRRIKDMNAKEEVRQERARTERLEGELKMMEKVLARKEEELERAKNGRRGVQTRASSVQPPGAASPRLVARGGGAGADVGSRGTSPLPGAVMDGPGPGLRFAGAAAGIGGRASVLRREG
ncbi:MAG: hypothetical protein Q9227_001430 [Pyrenula ochraceoflavens]